MMVVSICINFWNHETRSISIRILDQSGWE